MSATRQFTPSTVNLSFFALTNNIPNFIGGTEKGPQSHFSVQGTHLSGGAKSSSLHRERGLRCRIQWLGATSQFLVPYTPQSGDSRLVVTGAVGGMCPPAAEWILNWRDGTSECTIQSVEHDAQFIASVYLGANKVLNLRRVQPPPGSASSTTWGDVQEEWTCLINLPDSKRLSVPLSGTTSLVSLVSGSAPVTKNDIWRIQFLREVNAGTSLAQANAVPHVLNNPAPPIPKSAPSVKVAHRGMRCWLFGFVSGARAYFHVDKNSSLAKPKNAPKQHPSEWIITPFNRFYTIQLAQDSSYLAPGPPVQLCSAPVTWIIKTLKITQNPQINVKEQWDCTIHPPAQSKAVLKLKTKRLIISQVPSAKHSKSKYQCGILFLNDNKQTTNPALPDPHEIESSLSLGEEAVGSDTSSDTSGEGYSTPQPAPLSGGSPAVNDGRAPVQTLTTPSPSIPRPSAKPVAKVIRCWLFLHSGGERVYLHVARSGSLIAVKPSVTPRPVEWILTPTDRYYTFRLSNHAQYLSVGSSVCLWSTPTMWFIRKLRTSQDSQLANVKEEWECTMHPTAKSAHVLGLEKMKPVLLHSPGANSRLKAKFKCGILFLKDGEPVPKPEPPLGLPPQQATKGDQTGTHTWAPDPTRCRISCGTVAGLMYLAPSANGQDDSGFYLIAKGPPEWVVSVQDEGYKLLPAHDVHNNQVAKTLWALPRDIPTCGDTLYTRSPGVLDSFVCEIRTSSSNGPAATWLGVHRKDETGGIIVTLNHGIQVPQWRLEILGEETVVSDTSSDVSGEGYSTPQPAIDQADASPPDGLSAVTDGASVVQLPGSTEFLIPNTARALAPKIPPHVLDWVNNHSVSHTTNVPEDERNTTLLQAKAGPRSSFPMMGNQPSLFEKGMQECRIEHIWTGLCLALRTGAKLDGRVDTWIMQPAGRGYSLSIPPSDNSAQMEYLALVYDSDSRATTLDFSKYPATWDISQRRERPGVSPGVEAEWICRLRWPFSGQLLLAEPVPDHPSRARLYVSEESHNAHSSRGVGEESGELGQLHEYWRIEFLAKQ